MNSKIEEFIKWAEDNHWIIERHDAEGVVLPSDVTSRYKVIPDEFLQFLKLVRVCISPDEKFWILCQADYTGLADSAFSWNEFEKMSLEAAGNDREWKSEITEFWDENLPVALCVTSDYAYYALDVRKDIGSVVFGYEPEFEEVGKVKSSFLEFLDGIMNSTIEI